MLLFSLANWRQTSTGKRAERDDSWEPCAASRPHWIVRTNFKEKSLLMVYLIINSYSTSILRQHWVSHRWLRQNKLTGTLPNISGHPSIHSMYVPFSLQSNFNTPCVLLKNSETLVLTTCLAAYRLLLEAVASARCTNINHCRNIWMSCYRKERTILYLNYYGSSIARRNQFTGVLPSPFADLPFLTTLCVPTTRYFLKSL